MYMVLVAKRMKLGDGYKMLTPSLRFDFTCSYLLYTNKEAVKEHEIVVDYLSEMGDIDGSIIGSFGESQGCTNVFLAASICSYL